MASNSVDGDATGGDDLEHHWRLGIDTSGIVTQVGLTGSEGHSHAAVVGDWQSHNESLAVAVQEMTLRADCSFENLHLVAVGSGPGSFTGLRIGFAFAKALASSRSVPLAVVSSFLAHAWEFRRISPVVCVVGDARRSEYFYEVFSNDEKGHFGSVQPVSIASRAVVESSCAHWASLDPAGTSEVLFVPISAADSQHWPREAVARNVGTSLVELAILGRAGFFKTVEEIAMAQPEYLREVAALTIVERAEVKLGALR